MTSIYSLLNVDAKEWHYHQKLRARGQHQEARVRERNSIKSTLRTLRKMLDNPQHSYFTIGRGGIGLYMPYQSISVPSRDMHNAYVQACLRLGIPGYNTLTISDDDIYETIRLPMICTRGNPDSAPYGALSYAPMAYVFRKLCDMGAILYNPQSVPGYNAD